MAGFSTKFAKDEETNQIHFQTQETEENCVATFSIDVVNSLTGAILTSVDELRPEDRLGPLRRRIAENLNLHLVRLTLLLGEAALTHEQDESCLRDLGVDENTVLGLIWNRSRRVLCFGGWDNPKQLSTAECLELETGEHETLPDMPGKRAGHCAILVDESIIVLGGYDGANKLDSVDEFHLVSKSWRARASMSTHRTCPSAVLLHGKIHVWGGKDQDTLKTGEVFDAIENVWSPLQPMLYARELFDFALNGHVLYAVGGYGNDGGSSRYLKEVETLNIQENVWEMAPSLSRVRAELTAAACNNKVYAIGGTDNSIRYLDVEILDVEQGVWTIMEQKLSMERTSSRCACIDGKIYVFGGLTTGRQVTDTSEVFDPEQQSWSAGHSMSTIRCLHTIVVV